MTTIGTDRACLNCAAPLQGDYCAQCGQKAVEPNPTLHQLGGDVVHELLDVDGRTLRSIRLLFTRPGALTRAYVEGRRAPFISPLRLYLIFSVLFFAVSAWVGVRPEITEDARRGTTVSVGGIKISGDVFFKDRSEEDVRERLQEARLHWPPRLMFVLVPVCGLLVMAAARGSGRNFPQHLWFALHGHAAYFGVMALTAPLELARQPAVTVAAGIVRIVFVLWYSVTAFRTAYGGGRAVAVRRALLVLAGYAVLISVALILLFVTVLLV